MLLRKWVALFVAVVLVSLCFTGCATMKTEGNTTKESMFVVVENGTSHRVVYHEETKVMYVVSTGGYNGGNFVLLVNADGTPMVWDGDNDA